jgi:hypothetical protein
LNRNLVLLFTLVLLAMSSIDQTAAPVNVRTRDPANFVISQTQMPIYKMVTPEVNATYAQSLASSLFNIRDVLPTDVEGRLIANLGNRSFEVDSSDGSLWYADYSKLWNISLDADDTTPSDCQTAATDWLLEKGLLPENAVFREVGNTTATVYDTESGETTSKVIQYHVSYEFEIGEYPIAGEVAQISVIMGSGNEIIGFDWLYRDIEPEVHATASLIEYESILDTYGISASDVVDHRLVYDTQQDTGLLFPVYQITFSEEAGEELDFNLKIDATDYKPVVVISQPSGGIHVRPGQTITFDCNVGLGTPPYTYEWRSDFDGVLSTSKTFSISTLSEVFKKSDRVRHAVSVSVWDSEDRFHADSVSVLIDSDLPIPINVTILLGLGVIVALLVAVIAVKKRGAFALLFFLFFSTFMLLPAATARGVDSGSVLTPAAPSGAYDDGLLEVGAEWIALSHERPLYHNEVNTEGFYNWMGTHGGYSREFIWHEYSAWESDLSDSSLGGHDDEWADAVDFVYVHTHGDQTGLGYTSWHYQPFLNFSLMRLGDGDLETLAMDACKTLAWTSKTGQNVFERFGPVLQGIHQICGFATNSDNSAETGPRFGLYMTGYMVLPSATIVNAWFRSCLETEGSAHVSAVIYATMSTNPYQPLQDDPINDYAYGFGYTCSDPTPSVYKNFVYITSSC